MTGAGSVVHADEEAAFPPAVCPPARPSRAGRGAGYSAAATAARCSASSLSRAASSADAVAAVTAAGECGASRGPVPARVPTTVAAAPVPRITASYKLRAASTSASASASDAVARADPLSTSAVPSDASAAPGLTDGSGKAPALPAPFRAAGSAGASRSPRPNCHRSAPVAPAAKAWPCVVVSESPVRRVVHPYAGTGDTAGAAHALPTSPSGSS